MSLIHASVAPAAKHVSLARRKSRHAVLSRINSPIVDIYDTSPITWAEINLCRLINTFLLIKRALATIENGPSFVKRRFSSFLKIQRFRCSIYIYICWARMKNVSELDICHGYSKWKINYYWLWNWRKNEDNTVDFQL